jgi:hypothetical protein
MMQVDAHVMSAPEIEYGQDNLVGKKSKWDNMNKIFFETRTLTPSTFKWAFINASTWLKGNDVERILKALITVSESHSLNLGDPSLNTVINLQKNDLESFFTRGFDFIVFILPDKNSSEAYSK